MSEIRVIFAAAGQDPIELAGCESAVAQGGRPTYAIQGQTRVKQYPAGHLFLKFAAGSEGGKELARRYAVDQGSSLEGRITVTDGGETTDYGKCGYMGQRSGTWEFVFACLS